jgi:hypothetical protein
MTPRDVAIIFPCQGTRYEQTAALTREKQMS